MTGTSAAAPLVAGVAGLLKTLRGWMSAQRVAKSLIESARKAPQLAGKVVTEGVVSTGEAIAVFKKIGEGEGAGGGGGTGGGGGGGQTGGINLDFMFPPWKYDFPSYSAMRYAGHHFILKPPILKDYEDVFQMSGINIKPGYVRVYQSRLLFEILASALISCSLYLFLKRKMLFAVFCAIIGSLVLVLCHY